MTDTPAPPRLTREQTREKLKKFLRDGGNEDVATLVVQSLLQDAEKQAEKE